MKKFNFDLESILILRKHREREAEIALGREVSELNRIERNIADIAAEKHRTAEERFRLGYAVSELLTFDLYIQRLERTTERLLEDAAKAEIRVEEARKVYIEAERERDILDKVKETEAKEHRKQGFIEETKTLDDISNILFKKGNTQ